jgi:nitroimidazol reductase NimA-like FMN-containing flavoprotein (pyridoxamine 5'-phosphate oxidase superfamily)
MTPDLRESIVKLMDGHRIMTVATNRADGWPQATVVGYANDGLILYSFVARTSQKYLNIMRDKRVSIAIANDFSDPMTITGLSLAANASVIEDRREFERACQLFLRRYPEYAAWAVPDPALAPILRMIPVVISVLDYSKGFGHSELVKISSNDLARVSK